MPAQVKSTSVAFSWVCTWVKVLGVKLGALHAQVRLSFQDYWSGCFGNSVKWDTKCLLTIFALWLGEIENAVGNLVTQPWWCEFDHWGCAASDKRRMNWHCVNKSGCSSSVRAGAHVPGYIQGVFFAFICQVLATLLEDFCSGSCAHEVPVHSWTVAYSYEKRLKFSIYPTNVSLTISFGFLHVALLGGLFWNCKIPCD